MLSAQVPALSKSKVNRSGEYLQGHYRRPGRHEHLAEQLQVAEEYRLRHAYPLKLVTAGLSSMARSESTEGAVGQRLKRMPAIVNKLRRYENMRLARMQDVGGCRAVLENPAQVDGVLRRIRKQKWDVIRMSDYREVPREETGYRGLHVIVARKPPNWGQEYSIEIQLRTPLQHRWAESVESWAAYTRAPLKDGKGPDDLQEYFRMASELIALDEAGETTDPNFAQRYLELEREIRARYLDTG